MTQARVSVGISIRCDDHDFSDLADSLDQAQALGVDTVELPTLAMDLVANGRMLPERVRMARAMLEGRPFRYTAHGPIGINLMDSPARLALHEDVLAASLEAAAELGAFHYIMHTGNYGADPAPAVEYAYAQQHDALVKAGAFAKSLGIRIMVENVFTYTHERRTALPSRLAREIEALGDDAIWACLDFSHAYINATLHGADFLAEAAALAPVAKHVHIHDSFGRPTDIPTYSRAERLAFAQGDLHLPLGMGDIPWNDLMRACTFAPGAVFNIELERRYWSHAEACVARTRELAAMANIAAG